jgi:hypothetical protein
MTLGYHSVAISTNGGQTWTQKPDITLAPVFTYLAGGNGKFLIVEDFAKAYVTGDAGTTWTETNVPYNSAKNSICQFVGGRFVINEYFGINHSLNGVDWTYVEFPVFNKVNQLSELAYANGNYLMSWPENWGGDTHPPEVWISKDNLVSWSRVVVDFGAYIHTVGDSEAGSDNFLFLSADGLSAMVAQYKKKSNKIRLPLEFGKFIIVK